MASFVIHDLRIVSRKEKSALRVEFHPKTTVIRGGNDTGKSSVMKSIFWCFGADPAKKSEGWEGLDVCAAVRFSVAGGPVLTILRLGKQFAVFDEEADTLLFSAGQVTKGIGRYLAEQLSFGLLLNNPKTGEPEIPPPAYYLLPYYIDQDAGWSGTWCSFDRLGQYQRWKADVAEYHIGLRANEYYQLKSSLTATRAEMEEPRRQERAISRAIDQVRMKMAQVPVDFDLARFQKEIDELVQVATGLANEEEEYRRRVGELSNKRAFFTHQLQVAQHALAELEKDSVYSVGQGQHVECPTCGATYENSILERFGLALDETQCSDLITDLQREIKEIGSQVSVLRAEMLEARRRHERIWSLLDAKRGTVTLHEVLQSEGRGQAVVALQEELAATRATLADLEKAVADAQAALKALESRERKRRFLDVFNRLLARYAIALHISAPPPTRRFDFVLHKTGSDLPRAILAYVFAILGLSWENGQTAGAPLVIDSPNQQDQEPENLLAMLQFIRDNVPPEQQLILGLVDPQGVDFGGSEIEFTTKWRVLSTAAYDTVGVELQRLLVRAYQESPAP